MELSKRLSAVAALVTDGYRLADIGTDHAYIPICLAGAGRIPEAVAMDVNQGPLFRAEENIRMHGLEDRIKTRISDGFASLEKSLEKGEADAAVIAGMGGPLMIRILREGAEVVSTLKECVLQPQSEIEKVRAFLLEEGFFFLDEDMVEEDGKYYPMMKVQPLSDAEKAAEDRSGTAWTRTELCYGKLLLMRKNPILKEFLQREICIRRRILNELKNNKSLKAVQRRQELEEELKTAEKGMDYYAV